MSGQVRATTLPRRPHQVGKDHRYLSRLTMRPSMSLAENSCGRGEHSASRRGTRALQGKDRLSGRLLTSGRGARSRSAHSPSPGYLREKKLRPWD